MAVQAGWLNRRVAVYRLGAPVDNGFTKVPGDPVLVGSFAAAMEPVSDAERARAGEAQATVTVRFLVRRSTVTSAIDETCSLVFEGRQYGIAHAKESARWKGVQLGPREAIEISATARAEG